MSCEQQVTLGGGRVFVLTNRELGAFLWGSRGKLAPGETLAAVCERTVMPGQGLGLEVRVVLTKHQGQGETLPQFFIPDFKEKNFPWNLFLTPQTMPVMFQRDNTTLPGVSCITVHRDERVRQDLNTGQEREFVVYHTTLCVPTIINKGE